MISYKIQHVKNDNIEDLIEDNKIAKDLIGGL